MQHKGTFEDKLKKRLYDAGLEPPDLWSSIEDQLDERERRRGFAFWWSFDKLKMTLALLLLAIGGAAWWYAGGEKEAAKPRTETTKRADTKLVVKAPSTQQIFVVRPEALPPKPYRGCGFSSTRNRPSIQFAANSQPIDFVSLNNLTLQGFAAASAQMPKLELTALASPYPVSVNPPKRDSSNDWKKKRFAVGAEVWMTWADRMLIANDNVTATEADYVKFRNRLDNSFQAGSFGLVFSVKVSPKLTISSGFGRVNYTEQMVYSTIYTGPKTTATPLPVKPDYPIQNPSWYRQIGDSIYTEQKDSGRLNKYTFTDIPLSISYQVKIGKKWDLIPAFGLTYSRLKTINVDMPGMNHMGFISVTDKVNYEGIHSNIFNLQAKLSVSYTLGKDVKLNFTGTARCAMNPIITYAFAKQYPWALGVGVGIVREF